VAGLGPVRGGYDRLPGPGSGHRPGRPDIPTLVVLRAGRPILDLEREGPGRSVWPSQPLDEDRPLGRGDGVAAM
jgi:hypothetical protein